MHSSDELYGADRIVLHVATAIRDAGFDLDVWLPSDVQHGRFRLCEQLDRLDFRWQHCRLPILRRGSMKLVKLPRFVHDSVSTYRKLRRDRPDLVYLASSACLLVAPLARLARTPICVVHVQERWEGRGAGILRWLARWTTTRIAISSYVASASGLTDPAPVVILNAVDDAADRVNGSTPPRDTRPTFVVASRWNRWKGHATLIGAWDRAGCPGTLVVLGGPPAGGGVDVPALVAGLAQPDTVEVIGEVPDAAEYIAAADVLILPSDEPEPFGLVMIEAFALGRPVIASRAGGPLEVIEEHVTGWFFEPGDAGSLANVLTGLSPTDIATAGRAARRAYEDRFRPDRFRDHVARLISSELGLEVASGRDLSGDASPLERRDGHDG